MSKSTTRVVLFLTPGIAGRVAEHHFNSVARRMGLPWIAITRRPPSDPPPPSLSRAAPETLEKLGLPADSLTRPSAPAAAVEDLNAAARIVSFHPEHHRGWIEAHRADAATTVEYWNVSDEPDSLAKLEHTILGFVARLLGGTVEPQPPPVSTAPPIPPPPKPKPMIAKVGRETAGRRGKGVTTVFGLPLSEERLRELAGLLKQRCGTGGTVKDGRIEIQGDQRDRIAAELEKLGYTVKRTGG